MGSQWRPMDPTSQPSSADMRERPVPTPRRRLDDEGKPPPIPAPRTRHPDPEVAARPIPAPRRKKETIASSVVEITTGNEADASTLAERVYLGTIYVVHGAQETSEVTPPVAPVRARVSQSFVRAESVVDVSSSKESLRESIQDLPVPRNRRELRKFIDTARALRESAPELELVAAPLTDLLSAKKRKFRWTPVAQRAWDETKAALAGRLETSRPHPGKALCLRPEATDTGLRFVLFQVDDDEQQRVVAQGAAKYTSAERKYGREEKQALAIVWAIRKNNATLKGASFVLHAAKETIEWLNNHREERGRLSRWATVLRESVFMLEEEPRSESSLECLDKHKEEEKPGKDRPNRDPGHNILNALDNASPPKAGCRKQRGSEVQQRDSRKVEAARSGVPRKSVVETTASNRTKDRRERASRPSPRARPTAEERHKAAVKDYNLALLCGEEPGRTALKAARLEYCWPG